MGSLEACVSTSMLMKFFSLLADLQFNCFVARETQETPLYDFNILKLDEIAGLVFVNILCILEKSCRCRMQDSMHFHWVSMVNYLIEIYMLTVFFFKFFKFYLFLAVLAFGCYSWAFSSCGLRGLLFSCTSFSLQWLFLWCLGSVVVAHRFSCPLARGIFPDQGWSPFLLHWQVNS